MKEFSKFITHSTVMMAVVTDAVDRDHHEPAREDAEQEERVRDRIARAAEIHLLSLVLMRRAVQLLRLLLEGDLLQAAQHEEQN